MDNGVAAVSAVKHRVVWVNGDGGQTTAIGEGIIANVRDRRGDVDGCQAAATVECRATN